MTAATAIWSAVGSDFILKSDNNGDLVIAGYASVDMVDKQGDRIPVSALKKAFNGFMENQAYRNVQLAHSGIQVGEVLPSYSDSEGRVWKSEVDDHGLFVVCKIRNDIEKAREVQKQVRSGELRAFSIGGQALFRINKTTPEHGSHREITDMELHEITLCKKGINPESQYTLLKMDDDDMTNGTETLSEVRDALSRITKKLEENDAVEEQPTTTHVEKTNVDEKAAIAYIDSLEKFAHEQGVDLNSVRDHFGLGKSYMVGVDGSHGFNHRGQGDLIGSGEDATLASAPKLPNAKSNKYVIKQPQVAGMKNPAPQGNRQVIKQGLDLSPQSLERGYGAYSAIRDEEAVKALVEKEWNDRYEAETQQALAIQKENDHGSQIAALKAEIESLRTDNAEIQKSAVPVPAQSDVRVPTHDEFAALGNGIDGWKALEELGQRALQGNIE